MSTEIQIRQALEHAEEYIAQMTTFSDKKLEKHLDIIHKQSVIAEKEKMTSSLELLRIWRSQVIEARIRKAINNIADVPSEMELAIADMEFFEEKVEQRQEILKEASSTVIANEVKQSQEEEETKSQEKLSEAKSRQLSGEKTSTDKPEQLSLF
ncbi:MAG: hypothetical protein HY840_07290 [Bacteroidetes bacterium]|nr:hypothetical protein [Bacteroidota bacterium]